MKVYKIIQRSKAYYVGNPDSISIFAQNTNQSFTVEILNMTTEQFNSIPATQDAAEAFKLQEGNYV